jgi:hypothetical protein
LGHPIDHQAIQVLHRERMQAFTLTRKPRGKGVAVLERPSLEKRRAVESHGVVPALHVRTLHACQEPADVVIDDTIRLEVDVVVIGLQTVAEPPAGECLERVKRLPQTLSRRGVRSIPPQQFSELGAALWAARLHRQEREKRERLGGMRSDDAAP